MNQRNDRRAFLQHMGLLAGGVLLAPQIACSPKSGAAVSSNGMLNNYGIQLYTLRTDMPKDPKGVISKLSGFGYSQLEGYEGPQGLWWDMTPGDFKKFLGDQNLNMVSSHCNIRENFEEKAAQAAEVGLEYLLCPHIGAQKSKEDWGKVTDLFNECGKICKKNGIKFGYHNHEYSFKAFSGMIPQDFMMENTDPELVDFEMDIYWVVTGGADPVDFLTRYSNRFKLCHVKDRMAGTDARDASCDLGMGIIDFQKILPVARDNGMKYYILEQERYDNTTPLKAAEAGAMYLKNFKFS
ncbi:MAG: sugar phosphate isomerase/epimerase [Saprospiraceae bacterium]|nr:sugar phosphate isomerase/epimerase [Saprospiraceae bacterium]